MLVSDSPDPADSVHPDVTSQFGRRVPIAVVLLDDWSDLVRRSPGFLNPWQAVEYAHGEERAREAPRACDAPLGMSPRDDSAREGTPRVDSARTDTSADASESAHATAAARVRADENVRATAVARIREGERVAAVAAEVGVHPSTVRRWVRLAGAAGAASTAVATAAPPSAVPSRVTQPDSGAAAAPVADAPAADAPSADTSASPAHADPARPAPAAPTSPGQEDESARDPFMSALLTAPVAQPVADEICPVEETCPAENSDGKHDDGPVPLLRRPAAFVLEPVTFDPVELDPVEFEPIDLFDGPASVARRDGRAATSAPASAPAATSDESDATARDARSTGDADTAGTETVGTGSPATATTPPSASTPTETSPGAGAADPNRADTGRADVRSADASPADAQDRDDEPKLEDQPGNAIVEQLQVLATAPADAIVRFGNRLPLRDRYALVVTAWFATVLLAWVAPEAPPGRPILVALHLLAMTVAFGSVMVLDWHGILWERRHREIKESIRLSHALSPLIWGGLTVLFITGGLLAPDLSSPLAWLKLISVLLLALNGVATSQLRLHLATATSDGLRSLAPGPRSKVILSSVLSQACWLTAVLVGLTATMSR